MTLRLACSSGAALVAVLVASCLSALAANAHPLKPAGMVIPVETYYNIMLEENANEPHPIGHVEVRPRQLVLSGPCVYTSEGVSVSPSKRVDDIPAGQSTTYCAPKPGGHTSHSFIPRAKLINNPSMNFQPLLDKLGTQAVESIGLASISHGTPTSVTISVNPKHHTGEANVSYARGQVAHGTKSLKELTFAQHDGKEAVREVWY